MYLPGLLFDNKIIGNNHQQNPSPKSEQKTGVFARFDKKSQRTKKGKVFKAVKGTQYLVTSTNAMNNEN